MFGIFDFKLLVILTFTAFSLASAVHIKALATNESVTTWTSAYHPPLKAAQGSWIIPGLCPGGDISNTDEDALWSSIQYLQTMTWPASETKCIMPKNAKCITAACTNIAKGHPGAGGSSIVSLCRDTPNTVAPNCNTVGQMSQYIVGLCQNSQGSVFGSDGAIYNVTSGQLFDTDGWNVINNHDPKPC